MYSVYTESMQKFVQLHWANAEIRLAWAESTRSNIQLVVTNVGTRLVYADSTRKCTTRRLSQRRRDIPETESTKKGSSYCIYFWIHSVWGANNFRAYSVCAKMISGLKQSKGKQFQVDTAPEELLLALLTQHEGNFDYVIQILPRIIELELETH
jgi:hypothetical protein